MRLFKVSLSLGIVLGCGVGALRAAPATAAWPTLERQLAEAGAPADSALARLIRNNQNFELLRADESGDALGLPPWLRVLWRKNHPEENASSSDPVAVYPLVLKQAYRWMVRHPDLERVEQSGADPLLQAAKATGGANVKVSLSTIGRSESDIRINPLAPNQVIAAANYNDFGFGGEQAQFFSSDGGATWGESFLPFTGTDHAQADPGVDWTSDGRAWAITIGVDDPAAPKLRVRAYVSVDAGATWSFDGTPSATQTNADKPQFWVDHSPASAFRDTLYTCWRSGALAYVSRRTAAGWASPIKVSGKETKSATIGCHVMTSENGNAFVFWPSTGSNKLHVAKSTNGGASWGAPGTVATTFDSLNIGIPAMALRRALIYVSSGAYASGSINNVYAAWTDLSGETGCTRATQEPGSNAGSPCKTRIWFSRSTNGGTSWSAPVKINAQSSLNDQFNPWLAVDPTSGKVGIMYYDTVADPGRKQVHIYFQSSSDHGATWSAPLQVTTAPTDETTAGANTVDQFGDYNGMAAFLARFLPIWTDRRNNGAEEIWTAPVSDP